jgi:hypothetical protein
MRRSDTPFSLSSVLAQSPALRDQQRLAWTTWRAIVGHRVANHTMPLRVDEDTLHVAVSSALWASELSLLQTPILAKLRNVLPQVQLLRFRVGPVKPPLSATPPVLIHRAALPEDLANSLDKIEDTDLQSAIREAAGYSLGRAQGHAAPERSPSKATTPSFDKTRNKPF